MSRIIHVTEAFNGGVYEVILELINRFPNHQHTILYSSHSWDPKSDTTKFKSENVKIIAWEGSHWRKFWQLRDLVESTVPDHIHLHSTIAGIIGRLTPKFRKKTIYSPHAFAFQKLDVSKISRGIIFIIEYLLQRKTFANVAFWPIEKELFKLLAVPSKTIYAPLMIEKLISNDIGVYSDSEDTEVLGELSVVSIGRLAPQKDPEFFVRIIQNLNGKIEFNAKWFGDGTQFSQEVLEDNGILKTGWLEQDQIFREIKHNRSIVVFTSGWESGPITLFEALSTGIPVVCRSIDAFGSYGLGDGETPESVANRIIELNSQTNFKKIARDQLHNVKSNLPVSQTKLLFDLYDKKSM